MSTLVKFKSAVQPLVRAQQSFTHHPSLISTTTTYHSSTNTRTHTNVALSSIFTPFTIARRPISTKHANLAPTDASSQSHQSSSSSSSSTPLYLGLFGLSAAVGVVTLATSESVHAEAAPATLPPSTLGGLPTIDLTSTPIATSTASAAPESATGGKKKKKKAGKRKLLEYPGKFAKLHSAAESVLNIHINPGVSIQLPISAYHQEASPDKAVILIPLFDLGGTNGRQFRFNIQTHLGQKYHLEGYADGQGNSQGHFKHVTDVAGLTYKPSFQLSPNGNMLMIDVDKKNKENAINVSLGTHGEANVAFNQALTPNLVGGVEVHYALMMACWLNGGAKYTSTDKNDIYAFTKKDGKYTVSYFRKAFEIPHPHAHLGFPSNSTTLGVAYDYSTSSQKSAVRVGVKQQRETFQYQLALTSEKPALQMAFEQTLMPEILPNFKWSLNAEVPYDGSEMTYGIGFTGQI